ncbi:MAG: WG repeat-containing protein, partial [Clostridia bacterium]|nr:WG repeat-containing protein [Clostridia bacterium]
MKKFAIVVAAMAFLFVFSLCAYASDDLPSVYINDTLVSEDVTFVMQNSTMYLSSDDAEKAFGVEAADAGGNVFTFSTPLRVVTYDSATGSVNITDQKSFMYEVYEKAYPSYVQGGRVYIPLRMLCTSLAMTVDYSQSDNTVKVTSMRDYVGLFNSNGVAVAFRGGKYGLVTKEGDIVLRFSYDDISNFDNPLCYKLTDNHRCGLADSEGNLLTDIAYNEIRYESPSIIYIRQGNKWGMCDISGEIIIAVKYDEVVCCSNLIGMVKIGSRWYLLDCRKGELSFQFYDAVYKLT